jgi:hypothetical protein
MLAAFMLPILVQAAPRWRVLFGPLNTPRGDFAAGAQNFGNVPASFSTPRQGPDPELVRQSIAVLRAYVEQAGPQLEYRAADARLTGAGGNGSGNGRAGMSREEAFDLLGLPPSASAQEINDAHRRLGQLLDPQVGGTPYLSMKINEARDVLLGE